MAIKTSNNRELENKGYYIDTENDLIPRIKPAQNNLCGIESYSHLLLIFAFDVIYKFKCEDFNTENFYNTKKFTKAALQQLNRESYWWFKTREFKLLEDNSYRFNKEFIFNLKEDISSYYGDSAQPLVKTLLNQLAFFEDKF